MARKAEVDSRPPRRVRGRVQRDQFGSTKIGDDDGARLEPDGYPPTDWRTHANGNRPEPQPTLDAEEQAAGAVFNRPQRGSY